MLRPPSLPLRVSVCTQVTRIARPLTPPPLLQGERAGRRTRTTLSSHGGGAGVRGKAVCVSPMSEAAISVMLSGSYWLDMRQIFRPRMFSHVSLGER